MIVTGIILNIIYSNILFSGPLDEFNVSRGIIQIGILIAGIGVLLTLISFGLNRRKRRPGGGQGATTFSPGTPT